MDDDTKIKDGKHQSDAPDLRVLAGMCVLSLVVELLLIESLS